MLDGFTRTDFADQLRRFREELLYADLEIVGNRVTKLETQMKKKARPAKPMRKPAPRSKCKACTAS